MPSPIKFDQQKKILVSKSDIADVKQEVSNVKADLIKRGLSFELNNR